MLAAAHLDNFLFLLFVAIWIFFQVLTRAATKGRRTGGDANKRPPPTPQISRSVRQQQEQTDQERMRKFFEALGQPTTSTPPAPVRPRPTVFPRPMKSPLPPLTTRPPDLPREIRLPGQIPPTREARTFQPTAADVPFELHGRVAPIEANPVLKTPAEAYSMATRPVPSPASQPTQKSLDLAAMLRSSSGLRNAIILREIFGPPRAFSDLAT